MRPRFTTLAHPIINLLIKDFKQCKYTKSVANSATPKEKMELNQCKYINFCESHREQCVWFVVIVSAPQYIAMHQSNG